MTKRSSNTIKILEKDRFVARYSPRLSSTAAIFNHDYKNKNWLQFLFIVKTAVLKQQISKFYLQIQRTEASDHIYFSQRPFINVNAIFCA